MTAWEHRRTDPDDLTAREREVVTLICDGKRLKQIGELIGIRYETVRRHLQSAYRKLGVHSQVALVRRLRGPEAPPDATADTLPAPVTPTPLERALTAARELVAALEEMQLVGKEIAPCRADALCGSSS